MHILNFTDQDITYYEKLLPTGNFLACQSSGTSQNKKIIFHNRSNFIKSAQNVIDRYKITSEDTICSALPDSAVASISARFRADLAKSTYLNLYPKEKWNPQKFALELLESQCTILSLAPTQLFDLIQLNLKLPKNVRLCFVGGDKTDDQLWAKALSLGYPLIDSYGATETCGMFASSEIGSRQLILFPEVKIEPNEEGIFVSSSVCADYYSFEDRKLIETHKKILLKDKVETSHNTLKVLGRNDCYRKVNARLVNLSEVDARLKDLAQRLKLTFRFELITSQHARHGTTLGIRSLEVQEAKLLAAEYNKSHQEKITLILSKEVRAPWKTQFDHLQFNEEGIENVYT